MQRRCIPPPPRMDAQQVTRIKEMVASKYSEPDSASGSVSLGETRAAQEAQAQSSAVTEPAISTWLIHFMARHTPQGLG